MAIKVFSLASLTALGYSPTGKYNALNPSRINNPRWNFTPPAAPMDVDYLVIAGGGSGAGYALGGGGGAGGYRTGTGLSVNTGQLYTVTVGAGGASAPGTYRGAGSNSEFSSITSLGGGGGGWYSGDVNGKALLDRHARTEQDAQAGAR